MDTLESRSSDGIDEQRIRVLLAHLIERENVSPAAIRRAISRAADVQVGERVAERELTQAFVREEVGRLERSVY